METGDWTIGCSIGSIGRVQGFLDDQAHRVHIERVLSIYSADRHFESMRDAQIDLRCSAMVETKHSSETLVAFDDVRRRFGAVARLDQPIIDPLVIPLPVIVSGVLARATVHRRRSVD